MKSVLIVVFLLMFSTVAMAQTRKSAPAKNAQSVHSKRKAKAEQLNSRNVKRPLHPSRRAILKPPAPRKQVLHPNDPRRRK